MYTFVILLCILYYAMHIPILCYLVHVAVPEWVKGLHNLEEFDLMDNNLTCKRTHYI